MTVTSAKEALERMDEAEGLCRWACVTMDNKDRYYREVAAFWEVVEYLRALRDGGEAVHTGQLRDEPSSRLLREALVATIETALRNSLHWQNPDAVDKSDHAIRLSGGVTPASSGCTLDLRDIAQDIAAALSLPGEAWKPDREAVARIVDHEGYWERLDSCNHALDTVQMSDDSRRALTAVRDDELRGTAESLAKADDIRALPSAPPAADRVPGESGQ